MQERSCRLGMPGCLGVAHTGHHLVPRGGPHYGDDVPANIIPTCGCGTTGCHGLIEGYDVEARAKLARSLTPEEWSYLVSKMGGKQAATEWLARTHFVSRGEIRDLYH